MKIIDKDNVLEVFQMKFSKDRAKVIFHDDGDNTFAAYQIIYDEGKMEIWLNARTGDVIGSGRTRNRL